MMLRILSCLVLAIGCLAACVGLADRPLAAQDEATLGKSIYVKANCVGCHKWHGDGGGGYGGAALSLRKTRLVKRDIMATVTCGRPGTGMPYFMRDVYINDDNAPHPCRGLTFEDLGNTKVAEATIFLRPNEIEAVADYVLANIKGRGEPTLEECTAFFGDTSRVCETYKPGGVAAAQSPAASSHHALPTPTTTE